MSTEDKTRKRDIDIELTSFNFENQILRAYRDGDTFWFLAKDVCKILDIKNSRDFIDGLDDDERGVVKGDTLGGVQEMNAISESGLYLATIRSNKALARKFTRWVTKEVLPEIRRTGRYLGSTDENDRALFAETSQAVRRMGSHVRAVAEQLALTEQELSKTRHHLTQVAEICENAVESDLRLHGLPQDRDIASPILSEVYNHFIPIMEGLKQSAYLRTGMCGDEETLQAFYDFIREHSDKKGNLATDEKPKTIQ
ncbi:BRO family protein [Acidiphilium sp. PA]|uniref:BRO-N domain-containing protein n=1 Tax=Acidiphilium sp. PA TaxID=2871705 RepID=UPI002244D153|nr:BRO family protein [Acidiphilium sp. PA]MCW8309188.1 BRO family protein [Acidiphilium sp. PA]